MDHEDQARWLAELRLVLREDQEVEQRARRAELRARRIMPQRGIRLVAAAEALEDATEDVDGDEDKDPD